MLPEMNVLSTMPAICPVLSPWLGSGSLENFGYGLSAGLVMASSE